MDFEYSPKVRDLQARLAAFMDANVYPNEKRFHDEVDAGDRWQPLQLNLPPASMRDLAIKDGFKPVSAADAAKAADVINLLLPDEVTGDVFRAEIKPNLKQGNVLMASHGFNMPARCSTATSECAKR